MKSSLRVVLIGAGGFGEWYYLGPLLSQGKAQGFRLVGVVDPYPERCRRLDELKSRRIPFFSRLEEFFARESCDLVIVASPIHFHYEQTCLALAHGAHVLCEKPLCTTLEQIGWMEAAERLSGKTVTVGYQWSFSAAVQRLKADSLRGLFGRPVRFRSLVGWPRDEAYYRRNLWAGRQSTANGERILDSPVNNATAHYLHNMLYLLGDGMATSAFPRQVEAELWRANAIESYDTAALRLDVGLGAEVLFYTSHAVQSEQGPIFSYEYEEATIDYEAVQGHLIATFQDGRIVDYGSPDATPHQKIWNALESARSGQPPLCGIAAAASHIHCVIQAQESPQGIHDFPAAFLHVDGTGTAPRRYVEGLLETMQRCYREGTLFDEAQAPFAARSLESVMQH